jgi:thiamine-phosphate pyrophosphorylase
MSNAVVGTNGFRLGLYVITCAERASERGHLDVAKAALEGGADALQLRDKGLGGGEMYRLASRMKEIVDKGGGTCLFCVNDRVDVALAAGASGVHLGQEDLPAAAARSIVGERMVIGISAATVEEAEIAKADGADYLGVGPVFATPTKPDAGVPIGLDGLSRIRDAVDTPIVAIGGIDEKNAEQVLASGADGIAVISAVTSAADMQEAARRLRRVVDACLSGR